MGRIFKVQINLDEMNAQLLGLGLEDMGRWLLGFQLGACGKECKHHNENTINGYSAGVIAKRCATEYSEQQSNRARKRDYAGAMPGHNRGNAGAMPAHMPDGMPDGMPDACNPVTSNQYPLESIQKSVTTDDVADAPVETKKQFVKPTVEQVEEYCKERGNGIDPNKWMAHYESNGWKAGRNSMKDWKAAVRTWEPDGFRPHTPQEIPAHDPGWDEQRLPERLRLRMF